MSESDGKFENGTSVETSGKNRPLFKSIRDYFREYCVCTSIHGFRYFGEKRTIFERVWWFLVFSITLAACVVLIREVYRKWDRSPVIVSFATSETPIYKIPFPAVTICPESKFLQHLYNNTLIFEKKIKGIHLNRTELRHFHYTSLICNRHPYMNYSNKYTDTFPEDFFEQIKHISILNIMNHSKCEYMGKTENCTKIFTPIVTDEGICFTFNMLDRTDIFNPNVKQFSNFHIMENKTYQNWTMENGYSENAGLKPYPRRALLAGANNALSVTLVFNKDNLDYICKDSLQGYRVILHTPMRIPRPSQDYFQLPFDQVVVAVVQPAMIETSSSVQIYHPKRRKCYFPAERRLRYFKIYTQLNCKLECLTNHTLHECDCVNFFMPRDNHTDLCGTGSMSCMRHVEKRLQMGDLYKKLATPEAKLSVKRKFNNVTSFKKFPKIHDCDCMPICNDLSYGAEISQSKWDWQKAYILNSTKTAMDEKLHKSKLIIYFKSTQFVSSQRHELYGPTDFLGNFGGLLGLFTGFSVLSLMEIIYFLTVRLFCNIRLYGYWAGPET